MKAALHENQMSCYERLYEQRKIIELTGETVVSDKMPDIGLLGETNANALLRAKRTDRGIGILEGELHVTVCYLPDGMTGCCSLDLMIPWQSEFESDEIKDRCSVIGDVKVVQLETRMLNPRKILVKAQLEAVFTAFEKHTISIYDSMEETSAIQCRTTTAECSVIGTVCEKTFVAADEYPLPADLVGGNILCKSVQLRIDDVKTLTNKLIVKGSAISDVVMVTEQGYAERINFTSGFSMIAETDCESVSADTKMVLMPNALYYEVTSDEKLLSVEIHGVCQMLAYTKQKMTYISDVYSNFYECEIESKEIDVIMDSKNGVQREQYSVTIPARSQIARILFATASVYGCKDMGKSVRVRLCTSVCVVYENGTRDWIRKESSEELKVKDSEYVTGVRVADIYSVDSGEEAELRVSVEYDVKEERECGLHMITSVETDDEHPYCQVRPTLSVVRRDGELWELAREFGSTIELIKTYNQIEEDEVTASTLLLIPKQIR